MLLGTVNVRWYDEIFIIYQSVSPIIEDLIHDGKITLNGTIKKSRITDFWAFSVGLVIAFLIAFGTVLLVVYTCFNAHRLKQSVLAIINKFRSHHPEVEHEEIEYGPWLVGVGVAYLPILGFVLFIEYRLFHQKHDQPNNGTSSKNMAKKVKITDMEQIALEIFAGFLLLCFFIGLCGRDMKYKITKLCRQFRYQVL